MRRFAAACLALALAAAPAFAEPPTRIPVVVDTDIGADIDDAFALGLVVASPEFDLRAVTAVGAQAEDRAWIVCRFLSHAGVKDVPVAFGRAPQPESGIDGQIQYRRHPAVVFGRAGKPVADSAVELLYRKLKEDPGKVTLIALGPLTNVARLLKEHPDARPWIKRLVVMGGSVHSGYKGKPPAEPEWNVKSDVAAAREVLAAGVPLTLVPLDATATVQLQKDDRERLFAAHTPLTFQVQALYELWGKETPTLYDPVAVATALDERFVTMEDLRLTVGDDGMTVPGRGEPNARVATAVRADAFLGWFVDRLRSAGHEVLPAPPGNVTRPVPRGGFPTRVHAFEDYETDIESRWWLSGRPETDDLPPGARRACRAMLTQDFDDRMGDLKATYRAVVFNPVPGPPMGPATRLGFRYKLRGTDRLRVQLYSLTNGYHRYLSLEGLPAGTWSSATVDMTQMRRPDGGGGPLAEGERIDDIQFYADPRADLLVTDVVLYEAAAPGETRPFPQRLLFTGWFDTGKQGQEWPGDFEIVAHEKPRTWKAAASVLNADTGAPWVRLSLRGGRRLGPVTELFFRYRLTGADAVRVELHDTRTGLTLRGGLKEPARETWSEATLSFRTPPDGGSTERTVDEVRFLLPKEARLLVDDVLLYVPGEP
jgi:inosine-uridine nucleoside N-ribohydrolase